MFGKKKKPVLPKEAPPDAFNAIPHPNPEVEAKEDKESGKVYLRYPVKPANKPEEWISKKMGWIRYRQFDLDPVGHHFWSLIDGRRRLAEVERAMRDEFGWDAKTCREGVLQYTMTLMQKQLIFIDLSHRKKQ